MKSIKFYQWLCPILIGVLLSVPNVFAGQVTGDAFGVFEGPIGPPGMVTSGNNTSFFTWGDPGFFGTGPSYLSFSGNTFSPNFEEYISLGTLSYKNGTVVAGTQADAVFFKLNVDLQNPPDVSQEFLSIMLLLNTPNIGDPNADADYVFLPQAIAEEDRYFEADGIPVNLDIVGFGQVQGSGFSNQNEFFVHEGQTASTDLIARFTTECALPPGTRAPFEYLTTGVGEICFKDTEFLGTLFEDQDGNRLDLWCRGDGLVKEFALDYITSSGMTYQVGRCAWNEGQNIAYVRHTGDNNPPPGADCVFSVFWRSVEPGTEQGGDANLIDWKTYQFFPQTGRFVMRHFRSADGPGNSSPDSLVKEEDGPIDQLDILTFNPDPTISTGPMVINNKPICDVNGDDICDQSDLVMFDQFENQCRRGSNYNELADANHDGCVTASDRIIIVSADLDRDGEPDITDECPNSDKRQTVFIGKCDSQVENRNLSKGCRISDSLSTLQATESSHGGFVSQVSLFTNKLVEQGKISGSEKGEIESCAAQSE